MDNEFIAYQGLDAIDCGEDPTRWAIECSESLSLKTLTDEDFRLKRVDFLVVGLHTSCQLDCVFCTAHSAPGKELLQKAELSCERLVEQVLRHKALTGHNIAQLKFGCIGEVLIHPQFRDLIRRMQHAVDHFHILTNLSVRNRGVIEFIAEHPQVTYVTVSFDAGDEETYRRLRVKGDFNLVLDNARVLARAGKKLSMHSIIFKENEESLLKLPRVLGGIGFEDLHIIYSFSPLGELREKGVNKPTKEEFREFFLKLAEECRQVDLLLSTSTCFFTPDMVGIIPGIENMERLHHYRTEPCPNMYRMTVAPDGSFYH